MQSCKISGCRYRKCIRQYLPCLLLFLLLRLYKGRSVFLLRSVRRSLDLHQDWSEGRSEVRYRPDNILSHNPERSHREYRLLRTVLRILLITKSLSYRSLMVPRRCFLPPGLLLLPVGVHPHEFGILLFSALQIHWVVGCSYCWIQWQITVHM